MRDETDALGHTTGDAVKENEVAATKLMLKVIIPDEVINSDDAYVTMTVAGVDTVITTAELREAGADSKGRYSLDIGLPSGRYTADVVVKIYDADGNAINISGYSIDDFKFEVTRPSGDTLVTEEVEPPMSLQEKDTM